MAKAEAASAAESDETKATAEVQRLVIEALGAAVEPLVSQAKRPFFISEEAAEKLTAAFDDLIEDCIDDDGAVDTDAVEEKADVLKALFMLVGK